MPRVSLALYRPHRWTDIGGRLICWWTSSPYSHCELVVDGVCYSSSIRDGGVRRKMLDLTNGHWDVIELPWASPERVRLLYEATQHEPYGWTDLLLRQVFNRPGNTEGWFCSEWCAEALGIDLPETYSPARLAQLCEMRNAR